MNFYLLRRDESIDYIEKVPISNVFREFTNYQKNIGYDEWLDWRVKNLDYINRLQTTLLYELNMVEDLGFIDFSDNGNPVVKSYNLEKNIIDKPKRGKFNNLISTLMYFKAIKGKDYCERDLISQEVGLKRFEMCLKHLKRGGNLMTSYFNFCYQGSLELIWLGLKLFEKVLFVDVVGERFYAVYMGFSPIIKSKKMSGVGDDKEFMKWLENVYRGKVGYMKTNMEEYRRDNQSLIKTKSKNAYEWMKKYVNIDTFFYKTKLDGLKCKYYEDTLEKLKMFYEDKGGNVFNSVVVKNVNKKEGLILRNLVKVRGYIIIEKWWNEEGQELCDMIEKSGSWELVETRNHFRIYLRTGIGILL